MTPWRIRPAAAQDAVLLSQLEREAFGARSWGADSLSGSVSAPGVFTLVGETADAPPQGFAVWRLLDGEAEILTLGVAPDARRLGLGGALLDSALEDARHRSARRLFLEVDAGNAPALALYGARGFAQVGIRRGYYRDGADALVMSLTL